MCRADGIGQLGDQTWSFQCSPSTSHVQVRSLTPEARSVAVAVQWLVSPMELKVAHLGTAPRG